MNIEKFKEVIERRNYVEKISYGEWTEGIEECLKKEIEILTEDISTTIDFLKNECTADEYCWISEVLEDVVEIVPSKEFVQSYKELMTKFPEEYSKYHIAGCIENAEAILRWEDEHGKRN